MGHKRDWKQSNKQLVSRGKINFWVTSQVFEKWRAAKKKKNGHPFIYSDELIKTMSYIRFKFHLSLRSAQVRFEYNGGGNFLNFFRTQHQSDFDCTICHSQSFA